ncbi:MarR family winged helix-turn-helix transcriptional regulator [Rugosimonospora africana]|uniref:MarR family transcriptional regulator n=1 Tax=Rugosimonospora africana TaxID=556532 RepID=A0A8J3QV04_9ACTN|nr:MarR family transcriptional regulator [Rugosimonospora africana]GIH16934.1 MarR family transcriptional regulator [Rugosimonospora africana]
MTDTRWLDAEEQRAWRAYLDATRLMIRAFDQQLQTDAEVSFTDYELLVKLSEAPGRRLRMRDLADATMSTRSGVTRAVTRLEQLGWVRRVECEDDRRGTHAELTPAGLAKLAAAAPGHVTAVREHLFDQLTPAQVDHLAEAFGQVADALQRPRAGGAQPEPDSRGDGHARRISAARAG